MALRQLWHPLNRHLKLLSDIYKASVERKPDLEISRVEDLFDDDYLEQIKWFDAMSEGPMSFGFGNELRMAPWFECLQIEVGKFKEDLNRIVDKYAIYLDPDTLNLVEQLINSSFVNLVDYGPTLVAGFRSMGYQRYIMFAGEGVTNTMQEYTSTFSKLVEIYNREAPSGRIVDVGEHMWRNDVLPKIGSARVSDSPTQVEGNPSQMSQ